MVERNKKWEEREDIKKAYNVGRSVYYVTDGYVGDSTFYVLYWPDRRKYDNNGFETVSIFDSFEDEEDAIDFLEEKVDEYR